MCWLFVYFTNLIDVRTSNDDITSNTTDYTFHFYSKNIVFISLVRIKTVEWKHVYRSTYPLLTVQGMSYQGKEKNLMLIL